MTPRSEGRAVTAVLMALVALAAISTAWLGPAARRMPLVVALPTLALLAIEWRRSGRAGRDAGAGPLAGEGALLGWLLALVGMTWALGILLGPPLFLAAYLRRRSREPWTLVALLSGGLWLATFVVLDRLLHLPVTGAIESWWRS